MSFFGTALYRLGRSLALAPRVITARAGEAGLQHSGVMSALRPPVMAKLASQVIIITQLILSLKLKSPDIFQFLSQPPIPQGKKIGQIVNMTQKI